MTEITKEEKWVRNAQFQKYFGTVFGITRTENVFRIEVGNEKVKMINDQTMSVADCQIIMDESGFIALFDLMKQVMKEWKVEKEKNKDK